LPGQNPGPKSQPAKNIPPQRKWAKKKVKIREKGKKGKTGLEVEKRKKPGKKGPYRESLEKVRNLFKVLRKV